MRYFSHLYKFTMVMVLKVNSIAELVSAGGTT